MSAQRPLLAVVAAVVSLAALEVVARRFAPVDQVLYRADDVLLYGAKPNSRRHFERTERNGGGVVEVRFNSRGYRGDELAAAPARRIVVYGDSFIEADATRQEETFTAELERRISTRLGASVEVVNAGVAGYGPDQEGLRLERELAELDADLLVLALYAGNDLGDVLRNRLYRLDPQGELTFDPLPLAERHRRWLKASSAPRSELGQRLELAWQRVRESVRGHPKPPPPIDYIAEALRLSREEYATAVMDPRPFVGELFNDHYDADVAFEPQAPSSKYKAALFGKVMARIQSVAERADRPLVVLVVPAAVDVCDSYDVVIDLERYPTYERRRLNDLVTTIVGEQGMAVLDLYPAFRAAGGDCPYFRMPDNHWNERGQALAAELFDRYLSERGLPR